MAKVVNNFIKGRMNKDLDDRLIPIGEYRNAINAQVSKSEGQNVGALENVLGNSEVAIFQFVVSVSLADAGTGYAASGTYNTTYETGGTSKEGNGTGLVVTYQPGVVIPLTIVDPGFGYKVGDRLIISNPAATQDAILVVTGVSAMKSIGFLSDELNNRIFLFLTENADTSLIYNPNSNNAIAFYDVINNVPNLLVKGAFLNFSQLFPITGVNLLENLLFFTDNLNQPRRINVSKALLDNTFYNSEDLISVAKYNPYKTIDLFTLSSNLNAATPATAEYETTMYDVISKFYPHGGTGNLAVAAGAGSGTLEIDRGSIEGQINTGFGSFNYLKDLPADIAYVIPSTQELVPLLNGAGNQIFALAVDYYDAGGNCTVTLCDSAGVATLTNDALNINQEIVFNYNKYYINNYNGDKDFLKDKFVRFAYRFKFEDGEYSIFSPFTQDTFIPKQDGYFIYRVIQDRETLTTNDAVPQDVTSEEDTYRSTVVDFMENKVNRILLRIPLPCVTDDLASQLQIEEIDILYKESDGLNVNVIESVKVEDVIASSCEAEFDAYTIPSTQIEVTINTGGSIQVGQLVTGPTITNAPVVTAFNPPNIVTLSAEVPGLTPGDQINFNDRNFFEFEYQSSKPYKVLPQSELARTYDKVPVKALSQEVISNRIVYGNFQNKHTPPASLNYSVGISDKEDFSVGIGQLEVINGPFPIGSTIINVDGGSIIPPVDSGSIVTGTGIDTNTTLIQFDQSVAPNEIELDKPTTDVVTTGDILTFTNPSSIKNTTSIKEYPNSSLKQNRTYQVGVTLSDKFGRTSSVILADKNTSVTFQGNDFKGATVFNDYLEPGVLPAEWPGDSLKVLFNSIIGPVAPTPGNLWPGIYNGDITSPDYNPLGWYSFKIVVKQTEQEYYNVYLPGVLAGYPEDNNKEINKTSHFVLINDNINKVPRDLSEVGPLQTQFRSSAQLYPRVINTCSNQVEDNNEQFYLVGETPIVSTIATDRDLFDGARVVGYQGIGEFYDIVSNPLIARLSNPSGRIGCPATIVTVEAKALATIGVGVVVNATDSGGAVIPDTYWIGIDPATITPDNGLSALPNTQSVIVSGQTMTAASGVVPPVTVEISTRQDAGPPIDYYIQVFAPVRPVINPTDVLTFSPTPKYRYNTPTIGGVPNFVNFAMPQLAVMETDPVDSLLDIFYETTTTGLISDLNEAVLSESASAVEIADFNPSGIFTEAITGGQYISTDFELRDTFGNPISYAATVPPLIELVQVLDLEGDDRSADFETGELLPVPPTTNKFNVKTKVIGSNPILGSFVYEGNNSADRQFSFVFRINYNGVQYDIVKSPITLGNEQPVPSKTLPSGNYTWIPGDSLTLDASMGTYNGSSKIGSEDLGLSYSMNAIGADGVNYGPFAIISGTAASNGNNRFTISETVISNARVCNITYNEGAGQIPASANPIAFQLRCTDDGGEFLETTFDYTFDYEACKTWTLTLPQENAQTYTVEYSLCGDPCPVGRVTSNIDSSPSQIVQSTICSKASCPDPVITVNPSGSASISDSGSTLCIGGIS